MCGMVVPSRVPLAIMTRSDYYVTMTGIRIADLKSRLSEHLRKVRAGGSVAGTGHPGMSNAQQGELQPNRIVDARALMHRMTLCRRPPRTI